MSWLGPVVVDCAALAPFARVQRFIGHHDCRVYVTDHAYFDVGAGSMAVLARLTYFPGVVSGRLGSIGRWCEVASTSEIMVRGEHRNDSPVNISFTALSTVPAGLGEQGLADSGPVRIGSGVVISAGAKVLSGVKIGDGAVVGAMSLANRDVAPYTIVGGVPARKIGHREPAQPWWDFSASYIGSLLQAGGDAIQDAARSGGPHEWRKQRPPFVVRLDPAGKIDLIGFLDGEVVRDFSQAPEQVRAYLTQAFRDRGPNDPPPYWLADCWPD